MSEQAMDLEAIRDTYHRGLIAEGMEALNAYSDRVPGPLLWGLQAYLSDRIPTGGFLRAVLENDFGTAISLAHPSLTLAQLKAVHEIIHGTFPARCHGSPEIVAAWLQEGK